MIYVSHLIPDKELKKIINKYQTGVESIEFSISENLDHLSESIVNYRRKLEDMGNPPLTLHGPFLDINPAAYDRLVREATMTRFSQCYEAALKLHADKVVFHSGMNPYVYYPQYWAEHVAKFWSEFMENRTEIPVVLENVFDRDWQLLMDVYKLVNKQNFTLCLDIGHAHCYSEIDVLKWSETLAPYVNHVHVHDNLGDRDAHTGLGMGNLPYKEVLKFLPETSERSWTIECMKPENVVLCCEKLKEIKITVDNEKRRVTTTVYDYLKNPTAKLEELNKVFNLNLNYSKEALEEAEIQIKYEGYIKKVEREAEKMLKNEEKQIPLDIDYDKVPNLASEARQKLKEIRPLNIAQAIRISGVNPADISILLVYLRKFYNV